MNQGKTDIEIAINESYWSEKTSGVKYGNLAHTSDLAGFVKAHTTNWYSWCSVQTADFYHIEWNISHNC